MRQEITDYFAHLSALGRTKDTIEAYQGRIKQFRIFLKNKKVNAVRDISIRHVRDFHDDLIKHKLKTTSRLAYMSTISAFLKWCHQHNLILTDIAKNIELPDKEYTLPPTPLTHDDIAELFAMIPTSSLAGKRNRAILEIFYACGLRKRELLNLNIGDIDSMEYTVFVHGKGNKDRVIPIHETALESIADYLQSRGGRPRKQSPLFVTHAGDGKGNKRMSENVLSAFFWKLNKKFKKHLHPHLFRHTCACHLLIGGADIRYVQALLGHESPDTTSRYLGLVKDDIKREYDRAMEMIDI